MKNVRQFPQGVPTGDGGGGDGGMLARLYLVPTREEMKQDIAAATKNMATRTDVELAMAKLKIWVLAGVVSGVVIILGLAIGLARAFGLI